MLEDPNLGGRHDTKSKPFLKGSKRDSRTRVQTHEIHLITAYRRGQLAICAVETKQSAVMAYLSFTVGQRFRFK